MTSRRALSYIALWLLLTAYYMVGDRRSAGVDNVTLSPSAALPFGDIDVATVNTLMLESNDRRVRVERSGEGWQVVEPRNATVPSDLISALLFAVVGVPETRSVSLDETRITEFGLHDPAVRLTLGRTDGSDVRVSLGSRNPAGTAVYARREGVGEVVLLGLNAEYYVDLVMEAVANGPPGGT